jgi:hypothetical protein
LLSGHAMATAPHGDQRFYLRLPAMLNIRLPQIVAVRQDALSSARLLQQRLQILHRRCKLICIVYRMGHLGGHDQRFARRHQPYIGGLNPTGCCLP